MHADRHTSRWVYTMFWTLTNSCFILLFGEKVVIIRNFGDLFVSLQR